MLSKISDFVKKYKKEIWFRPVAVLLIMLVLSFGYAVYRTYIRTGTEQYTAQTETETEDDERSPQSIGDFLYQMLSGSIVHFIVLGILAVALGAVRYYKSVRLKEKE